MSTKTSHQSNALINETSPYLLQHAYNPVNWFALNEAAFTKARSESKPVFLSIGYSTCHWWRVMEKESFADPKVAAILNKHFISIKVDREERPDIDHIYMTFCQSSTGAEGGPLTIIMTPEQQTSYAATYLPKDTKHGYPGLITLLLEIAKKWQHDRDDLKRIARSVNLML